MDPRNELPSPPEHLLLPKAHVHYFIQVVVFVLGILFLLGGIVLLVLGYGNHTYGFLGDASAIDQAYELLFFLASGIVLGSGVVILLGWTLWKFVQKFRFRFIISLIVSVSSIVIGLLSIIVLNPETAFHYTFYFFMLTVGLFSGLLSLFYFSSGLSRHVFLTHDEDGSSHT